MSIANETILSGKSTTTYLPSRTFSTENLTTLVSALLPLCDVGNGLSAITTLKKWEIFFHWLKKNSSDEHAQKLRVIWFFEALESENKNDMTAVAHGAHILSWSTQTRHTHTDLPNATQSRRCCYRLSFFAHVWLIFFGSCDRATPHHTSEILFLWADWYCGFVLSLKITYTNLILVSMNLDEFTSKIKMKFTASIRFTSLHYAPNNEPITTVLSMWYEIWMVIWCWHEWNSTRRTHQRLKCNLNVRMQFPLHVLVSVFYFQSYRAMLNLPSAKNPALKNRIFGRVWTDGWRLAKEICL